MRLVVTDFLTVDGVIEGPGFDEHRDGRNAWALRLQDEEAEEWNQQQAFTAEALLMGRVTYQVWAALWPTAGDDAFSRRMNSIQKYVVSRTLDRADWSNTTILNGDAVTAVEELKAKPGGELLLYGSADLVTELMAHRLVDEYRLSIYPVVLGSGKHLFRDRIDLHYLRLVNTRIFPTGIVLLTYQPETKEPTSRYVEDFAWTDEQTRSLQAAQNVDRVLATVLFTDIVDSTGRAASLGDRAWRQLLDRHDQVARTEVDRWHGRFIKNTGDGVLATFDAPTRALRCAFALRDALAHEGLEIRAAIHTGEVEMREGDVGGIAVHIASRALGEADDRQIVVTRTVRDLATGTDLRFQHLSTVSLRGVPGTWELYEVGLS
ncbi:MAG TPA: dihydrofolate reductase family protein [Candidatus Limnocylindria bacterium]|nr:dihydrofolate reductase family protein [Candidatus Limnocylindria bacterium]